MKREKVTKMIDSISGRDSLPLLRGMFVSPGQVRKVKNSSIKDVLQISSESAITAGAVKKTTKLMQKATSFTCNTDEGLYLKATEGLYLG